MRLAPLVFALLLLPICSAGYRWEPCEYVVRLGEIIRGRVVDDQTGEPVVASVVLENLVNLENGEHLEKMETGTNSEGGFLFVLPWGDFRFSLGFSYLPPGYHDWSENGWIKKGECCENEIRVRYDPFHLRLSENSGTLRKRCGERWGSRTLTIVVEPRNRYFGQVEFSVQSQGISASFSPPILLLSSHTTCQLTLLPSESLGAGSYEVRILAKDNRGRLVENVPYTLSLGIESGGGGGGGGGGTETRTHTVTFPLYIVNSKTLGRIPSVGVGDVKVLEGNLGVTGSTGNLYLSLSAMVDKGESRSGAFTGKFRVETAGYYPSPEVTVSGRYSVNWDGLTCSVLSVRVALDPREGWVNLSWRGWDTTPKFYLKPGASTASVSLSASGSYQWNSDYWLKYYSSFGKYGQVDEYWDGQKKDPDAFLAKTKTPWGGTYRATATGWVTDSGGKVVEMQLRSDFLDATGEYAVVQSGQERPVNMYASIGGPQVYQEPGSHPT
jgi:hypothetical protein